MAAPYLRFSALLCAATLTACGNDNLMGSSTVVPVPAAVWLFGSAIGVMGLVRRRLRV